VLGESMFNSEREYSVIAKITERVFLGSQVRYSLLLNGDISVTAEISAQRSGCALPIGSTVRAGWTIVRVPVFADR
jgi:hypothetical protein